MKPKIKPNPPAATEWAPWPDGDGAVFRTLKDQTLRAVAHPSGRWMVATDDGASEVQIARDIDDAKRQADIALGLAEEPRPSTTKIAVEALALAVLLPMALLAWGWGLSRLWSDNLVPFGLPEIGMWRMVGLLLCVAALRLGRLQTGATYDPEATKKIIGDVSTKGILLLCLVGWSAWVNA